MKAKTEDLTQTLFGVDLQACMDHPLFRSAIRKVLEDNGLDPDEWEILRLRKRGPKPGYGDRLKAKRDAVAQEVEGDDA